jgi:hypothetical protein
MLSVRISSPLTQPNVHELVRLEANAIASATWSTAIPGGYTTATITLVPGRRDPVPAGAHVELFWDGEPVWEGQRRRPKLIGRDLNTLECAGYGTTLSDAEVMQTAELAGPTEAQYPSATCLLLAMAMAPLLSVGPTWGQPAVNHPLSIFDGMTLWAVAQQLGNEAGFDWSVWQNRQASFVARVVPATVDYLIAEDDVSSFEIDDSAVWTRVSVAYTDAATGVPVLTQTFPSYAAEAQQGVIRHTRLPGGTLDASGAFAQAQTYLAQHIVPTISASLGPYSRLKTPFGSYTPGPFVQSRQWVQIQNREPRDSHGNGVSLPIVQTSCDQNGMVTATLGQPLWDIYGNLAAVNAAVGALKAGLNPVTGARA